MPGVARVNQDVSNTGHKIIEGAINTDIEGFPMALQGSVTDEGTNVIAGSLTVYAEDRQVARQGDKFNDGSVIATASTDIEVGDNAPDNISFIPADPYTPEYVRPLLQRAGSNAPHDEPATPRRDYGFQDRVPKSNNPNAVTDNTPVKQSTGVPVDCGDFTIPIDYSQNLSANYTVASVSRKAYFAHNIVAQHGLSESAILCNLKAVAENILEPLRAKYPGFQVNSGFRVGQAEGQHGRGQAVDVQWIGRQLKSLTDMAYWCRDNLPIDQFIFEHGNGGIWFHISYNRSAGRQRGQTLTYYPQGDPKNPYKPGITNYFG